MSLFVHGDNIAQKLAHATKYKDAHSRKYLAQIKTAYDKWRTHNESLNGPGRVPSKNDRRIIWDRVKLLAKYKDFVDKQAFAETFDSRSNLHSTILEEFIFYLFRDMAFSISETVLIGKASTFKDIFFAPKSFLEMLDAPAARIETKDHDFVIGVNVLSRLTCDKSQTGEEYTLQLPAVAIECKTYLDKTMLEGASAAAEQLKVRCPNAAYVVVAEWLKLTDDINLKKYKVDQIYILRKQKNTDREFRFQPAYKKNPVHVDVVEHLFGFVRDHLTRSWQGGVQFGLNRGYLL